MTDEPAETFTDPANVAETYVDTLLVAEVRNGLLLLTFGVRRTRERATLKKKRPLEEEVVAARLVLGPDGVAALKHFLDHGLVLRQQEPVAGPKGTN